MESQQASSRSQETSSSPESPCKGLSDRIVDGIAGTLADDEEPTSGLVRDDSTGALQRRISVHGFDAKLNRHAFISRLLLERHMLESIFTFLLFLPLTALFLRTLVVYSPLDQVSDLHQTIADEFHLEKMLADPTHIATREQLYEFITGFVKATYEHAQVLIDANTFDEINAVQCFSNNFSHVCELEYWQSFPANCANAGGMGVPFDCSAHINGLRDLKDRAQRCASSSCTAAECCTVRPQNMDGVVSNALEDLSNFAHEASSLASSLVYRTRFRRFARRAETMNYPADTAIKRQVDYPFTSLVPLAPLITQQRAPRSQCYGFGSRYAELLNETSFVDTSKAPKERYTLRYLARVSNCYNRQQSAEEDEFDEWDDSSQNFTIRTERAELFAGRPMFWKFFRDADELRRLNWIDAGTKSLELLLLFVSPQSSQFPDILTLLKVEFTVSQYGAWRSKVTRFSMVQTADSWYVLLASTLVLELLYFGFMAYRAARRARSGASAARERSAARRLQTAMELAAPLLQMVMLVWTLVIDRSFDWIDKLIEALRINDNSEETNLRYIERVVSFAANLQVVEIVGFWVVMISLGHMAVLMTCHPRLGVLAKTLARGADAMFHFLLGFAICFIALAYLGHWFFSKSLSEFGTVLRAMQTQFQMLVGEFPWQQDQQRLVQFELYVVVFVVVIFFSLCNFFLAIVVSAYDEISQELELVSAENSFMYDSFDVLRLFVLIRTRGFLPPSDALARLGVPSHVTILSACKDTDDREFWARLKELPPVELSELCASMPGNGRAASSDKETLGAPAAARRQRRDVSNDVAVAQAYMQYYFEKHAPCRNRDLPCSEKDGAAPPRAAEGKAQHEPHSDARSAVPEKEVQTQKTLAMAVQEVESLRASLAEAKASAEVWKRKVELYEVGMRGGGAQVLASAFASTEEESRDAVWQWRVGPNGPQYWA